MGIKRMSERIIVERLETERLILRGWKMEDAKDLYAYASTPKVGPMAGWKPHDDLEESKKIIEMFLDAGDSWALELKESHKVIGSLGLHRSKKRDIAYDRELGYVLAEEYWGQGLIPEAARAAIDYAFLTMKIDKLLVSHFDFNGRSKRVIEKLGFPYLAHLEGSWGRYDGRKLDEEVYLMTREAYQKICQAVKKR